MVVHVDLVIVRPVVGEIVLGVVQPLVQPMVLIALESKAQRVRHGVVQPVEALVQPVVAEVVYEMTDLDVPSMRRRFRTMSERVEQTVARTRFVADSVAERITEPMAVRIAELLAAQAHILSLGIVRPEPKSMVVPIVL